MYDIYNNMPHFVRYIKNNCTKKEQMVSNVKFILIKTTTNNNKCVFNNTN